MSLKDALKVAISERDQSESNKAVNTEINNAVNIESNKAVKEEKTVDIEMAGLTIKVPKKSRRHWLISAKQQNTSLTAAITEALNTRFGEAGDD